MKRLLLLSSLLVLCCLAAAQIVTVPTPAFSGISVPGYTPPSFTPPPAPAPPPTPTPGTPGDYRFGFNGKEKDDEINGFGNTYDYGVRMYDPRVGRFFSADPLQASYPWLTPYQFAGNTPVQAVDLDGKEVYDFRLDLNDKGQRVDFTFSGFNTHGINGWSIWESMGIQFYAVDVYQQGQYVGRYSSFANQSEAIKFGFDQVYRQAIMSQGSNEQKQQQHAQEVGQMVGDAFTMAATVQYAQSRTTAAQVQQNTQTSQQTATGNAQGKATANNNTQAQAAARTTQYGNGFEQVSRNLTLSQKTFGHTFTTHGDNMTNFLINRAKGSGMPQGQFLDNQRAAQFILNNIGKTGKGPVNIPIPQDFPARVILPDGSFKNATHIRLIPGGNGVKTAYPITN